jgi:phosphoribosylformylglycinamidine synthase
MSKRPTGRYGDDFMRENPMYKATVTVMLKRSVLDPQGAAVERALKSLGNDEVTSVRMGKVVELIFEDSSAERVETKVKALADKILANPVMEEYTVEVERLP